MRLHRQETLVGKALILTDLPMERAIGTLVGGQSFREGRLEQGPRQQILGQESPTTTEASQVDKIEIGAIAEGIEIAADYGRRDRHLEDRQASQSEDRIVEVAFRAASAKTAIRILLVQNILLNVLDRCRIKKPRKRSSGDIGHGRGGGADS